MNGAGSSRTANLSRAAGACRIALGAAVAAGAKSYGFTLVISATATLAVAEQGVPRAGDGFAFLGGALLGMVIVVAVSFWGLRATWIDIGFVRRAYGAIYALSIVVAVLTGWLLAAVLDGPVAFLAASLAAVGAYSLLLGLDVALSTVDVGRLEGPTAATSTVEAGRGRDEPSYEED